MSCWCGHGTCHHGHGPWRYEGYGYGPPPPGPWGPGPYGPEYGPRWRAPGRAWRSRELDLAEYLADLEGEVSQVREELERLRQSRGQQES
jgi:hypothetical protein